MLKNFKAFLKNERGQADIVGNIITILKTKSFIMVALFLAIIYSTTLVFEIGGAKLSLGESVLTPILLLISNALGFSFDYRLFVIICFLAVCVGFIFKYGHSPKG